jgi:transposase
VLKVVLKGSLKSKEEDIRRSLENKLSAHQQQFLQLLLRHLDEITENILLIESLIEQKLEAFECQVKLLRSIPGIEFRSAAAIIAEIGVDMSRFDSPGHIASWAGISPGQNESAGKKKPARSLKGNPHIKRILCEIAWVVTRMRNTYLSQ